MQVVIRRSDLTSQEPIPIFGSYEDGQSVASIPDGMTVIQVDPSSINMTSALSGGIGPTLASGWRDINKQPLLSAEATARIDAVFPEYSQRNSLAELTGYILQHGGDVNGWPAPARARKAEIDRCWAYINAVRAANRVMMNGVVPNDPTDDAAWPVRIAPYQPSTP